MRIWRFNRRRNVALHLMLVLCLCALLLASLQQHYGYFSLDLASVSSPKGVYSNENVGIIAPETMQLLQDNASQFWNCELPTTPCRYFNPYHFFQEEAKDLQEDYKRLGGANNNLPAMTALSWSSTSHKSSSASALPQNLSFVHIHKSGGTTVKTLLAQAKQRLLRVNNTKAELNNYKYSFGGGSLERKERNQQKRQAHIEGMIQLGQPSAVVFALVRDPLERFVSAVQQVMHYNEEFRQKCLKWTTRTTLQCAIQYTRETRYLRDVHIIPMATHFRLWDQYETAQIAILHIQEMPVLAKYLGVMTNQTTTATMPHARDRSQVQYATSKVLANMNVQRDCSPQMIEDLCRLYAIDVVLLKSLGYDSPYCVL